MNFLLQKEKIEDVVNKAAATGKLSQDDRARSSHRKTAKASQRKPWEGQRLKVCEFMCVYLCVNLIQDISKLLHFVQPMLLLQYQNIEKANKSKRPVNDYYPHAALSTVIIIFRLGFHWGCPHSLKVR